MPVKFALRTLMEQTANAESLDAVFDSALACLKETLSIDRASVLVLDASRTMRFVAWSGLSDGYRAAVDGHSPWSPDEPDARPVLVEDIDAATDLAAYRALFASERIRALAFIPLRFGPKLLGKFMLYYAEPHTFTAEELTIAETIAGYVAFALEHDRIAAALANQLDLERELRHAAETEAALRHSNERRLHLALEAGHMGVWEWDIATGRVEWSPELETLHSLAPGTGGGTFADFHADMHPDDASRVDAAIEAALAGPNREYQVEYRIVRPGGPLRWVAARGRAIVDTGGQPVRMLGICRDVSERRWTQEARDFVAEASRVLATTLDPQTAIKSLTQIVVPRLADWCVVHVLEADGALRPAQVVHRDAAKAALASNILRRWPTQPEDSDGAFEAVRTGKPILVPRIEREQLLARARDREHRQAIESLGLRSAVTVPLQARGRMLGALSLLSAESRRIYGDADVRLAAEIASWAALAIDNAQLHGQAEEAHAAAEHARRQIETLAEISAELAVALDPLTALQQLAARLVPALADCCITYGFDGKTISRLGLAHRDPAKLGLVAALRDSGAPTLEDHSGAGAVIRTGEPILASEISPELLERSVRNVDHLRAVRALTPESAMVVPLKARGRTLGAIAFAATAESGRRYGTSDLKIAMELANRAALLIDNARLYAEARSAVQARDDMIAVVSHDLRNPLQSIAAAAALLKLDLPAERRARSLDSIAAASAQMERLLNDLLDISRMDAGQFSVDIEPVEVGALLAETHSVFQPIADERGTRLHVNAAENLPPVAADRGRILQVLANLIGNALKFVTSGGTVTVSVEQRAETLQFAVTDTGAGIAPEHLGKVFDRFWRGEAPRERGAGLGLAVAKGIVEAHGGQIGVMSRVGHGSTFYFTLRACGTGAKRVSGSLLEPAGAGTAGRSRAANREL